MTEQFSLSQLNKYLKKKKIQIFKYQFCHFLVVKLEQLILAPLTLSFFIYIMGLYQLKTICGLNSEGQGSLSFMEFLKSQTVGHGLATEQVRR